MPEHSSLYSLLACASKPWRVSWDEAGHLSGFWKMLSKEAAPGLLPNGVVKGPDQAGQKIEHEIFFSVSLAPGRWSKAVSIGTLENFPRTAHL